MKWEHIAIIMGVLLGFSQLFFTYSSLKIRIFIALLIIGLSFFCLFYNKTRKLLGNLWAQLCYLLASKLEMKYLKDIYIDKLIQSMFPKDKQ